MSLFTKLVKKSVVDFLKRRKKWFIIPTAILAILICVNLILNHYVDRVVGTLIKEFVHERSEGFYYVDFDEITYILNSRSFLVREFKFDIHPDHKTDLDLENLQHKYIYSAVIPNLHIDIIDFLSIFISRKLRVIGVEITRPVIKVLNLNKNKNPKKISFEAGNLYEILSDHLRELKVNDFLISDAIFDYETYNGPDFDNFQIKELTFKVSNFQVNEESNERRDKIFYTDDIYLEVKDQKLFLKDSIHRVSFDKFILSTSKNEFEFENFRLSRRPDVQADTQSHDHYEVHLPELRLAGIDFLNAYNNNILIIDSLNILDPVINIKKRTLKQPKDSSRNSILDVAMVYHDFLKIKNFNLDDAYFIYTDETHDVPKQYSVDHISAHVTKVEIDSGRNSKYQYGFNFDEVDLMIKDYEVKLPDSVNTIKFDEFSISSDPFEIKLKDLNIQPNVAASKNKSLLYASIPYLVISEFDVARAINMDTFLIDEIYVEHPEIEIVRVDGEKENNPPAHIGGLFGTYSYLQSISDYFKLNQLTVSDGKIELKNFKSRDSLLVDLNKVSVSIANLELDSLTNTSNDIFCKAEFDFELGNSLANTPIGNFDFQKLNFTSAKKRLQIDSLTLNLDSSRNHQEFHLALPQLLITGINPNEIVFSNEINLDSLRIKNVDIQIDILDGLNNNSDKGSTFSPHIRIRHLTGHENDIGIRKQGLPVFFAEKFSFDITNFVLDRSLSENPLNQFDYDQINLISIEKYDYYLSNQNHVFHSEKIRWNNPTSTFSMNEILLKPFGKANNRYDIEIPNISMSGIDLKSVLKESYYDGDTISLESPKIKLNLAKGKQEKLTSLDLGFIPVLLRNRYKGAKAKAFKIENAQISIQQKIENDSLMVEIDKLNLYIDNFEVDSTTEMVPDRFLFANDVRLESDYLSYFTKEKSDFYGVNSLNISTKNQEIRLNGLYMATNTNDFSYTKPKTKISIENLNIFKFDFFNFTQNQFLDISEIQIGNANVYHIPALRSSDTVIMSSDSLLYQELLGQVPEKKKLGLLEEDKSNQLPDSTLLKDIRQILSSRFNDNQPVDHRKQKGLNIHKNDYVFDTVLLKKVEIDRLLLSDSKIQIESSHEDKTGLTAPDIWLIAEELKYDPVSAKDSTKILFTENLKAKITNFKYVLPDNLTSLRADEIMLNSADSTIKANNVAFIPLVSRYDFGPTTGYQSTWMRMENDSITVKSVDFLSLLNERSFRAKALDIHKLDMSIFRDKRIPFPEWQRKPLPQTSLRDMNFVFGIDTLNLHDGFISYQEHSEQAYTTGEVFFSDLNATIINATNDSVKIRENPYTRIGAKSKIFGVGTVNAEFMFDLVDMENIHTYGIDVEPFDLTEFNRILIPSASVQISSGNSNRIIMTAKANEDFSFGEMKFYYEDLKIQLLNRETEKPKGIGNVLGSFFANTFIIKSNNPRNLFLRKGDIFFERDKKRAIFNYWTKTFLSGVVSSIGATNNKKKIKKMQEENLKKIQEEKNSLTSL